MGLDLITPESLYGYEPDNIVLPGDHSFTTERVVLPDTSQFVENAPSWSQSLGPLISFPKYNNYLQDISKFDTISRVYVPLKLLGIKPIENGELITKHTLSDTGAVVSYAQYKSAGMLFPQNYDASVMRRWGVDITVGSPLISVSILVPEYVEASENLHHYKPVTFEDVQMSEKDFKKMLNEPHVKIHENEAHYLLQMDNEKSRRTRSVPKKLFFKDLGKSALNLPVRIQMWLDANNTVFNERSNPQCVHWSVLRG